MSARHLFPIIASLMLGAFTAWPGQTGAQPLLPEDSHLFDSPFSMNIAQPSLFMESLRDDQALFARMSDFTALYNQAIAQRQYQQALNYTDSLINTSEHHHMRGVRFAEIYETRARLFDTLNMIVDACLAYQQALGVQDSLMRFEQTTTLQEMQVSYELDRLALDQALQRAQHHKTMLLSVLLLLIAAAAAMTFIYRTNKRIRRLQKELLLEMTRARESEAKKIAFINSICHEVRTPLNCVSGFSELMCENEVDGDTHGQYSEIIRDNCRQLRYLFDDLLEVSYLESLDQPFPYRYTDLCTLCRTQLRIMKVRYPKAKVSYEEDIPAEKIALISNEKYLSLLLSALLGNAYKFTEKGVIRLECSRKGEEYVRLVVSDTGPGIPADQHAYVFERFTKLDTFSQGNGLGLYLCRLIVHHLDGEIQIDPTYTSGTRMVVTLPRRPKNAGPALPE